MYRSCITDVNISIQAITRNNVGFTRYPLRISKWFARDSAEISRFAGIVQSDPGCEVRSAIKVDQIVGFGFAGNGYEMAIRTSISDKLCYYITAESKKVCKAAGSLGRVFQGENGRVKISHLIVAY